MVPIINDIGVLLQNTKSSPAFDFTLPSWQNKFMRFLNFILVTLFTLSMPTLASPLKGTWIGECLAENGSLFVQEEMNFANEALFFRRFYFGDKDCSQSLFEFQWSATYSLPPPKPGALSAIDFVLNVILVTPQNGATALQFNQTSFCGKQGWKEGISMEVTGEKCGDNQLGKKGIKAYNSYLLEQDVLRTDLKASSYLESERPHEISPTKFRRP